MIRTRLLSLLVLAPISLAAQVKPALGVDPAYMDKAVQPCADFYAFACGAYDKVPIPAAYANYGVNQEIDARNDAILKAILESTAAAKAAPGTPEQRIGDFYASGMDEGAIEAAGLKPLQEGLDLIAAVKDADSLADALAWMNRHGARGLFAFGVGQDDKDATAMIARFRQPRLGLPEREFYFRDDARSRELRAAYEAHLTRLFKLAGAAEAPAAADARAVLDLETVLAAASRKLVDLRDPEASYHKLERAELGRLAPAFPWERFFAGVGVGAGEKQLLVGQPEVMQALSGLVAEVPAARWQPLLRASLLDSLAAYLPKTFEAEAFAFYGKAFSGRQEQLPRWRRVKDAVDGGVGFDLGRLYVAKAFSPRAKAKVEEMVRFHKAAMKQIIQAADWMAAGTKEKALHKLDTMVAKVGYPDAWRDYSKLKIGRDSYAGNELAARAFEHDREMAKLGRPVDRGEWGMTPPTNNAYYNPSLNEIALPAGILQPPFFDEKADDASNYGALASTIGHELTHGFDDQGRQYDADGNLKPWWTDADAKAYQARAAGIVRQYDAFEAVPGVHLNGRQTLGENIADVGGLKVSFRAYRLAASGKAQPARDGLAAGQRFFVAFAQGWRTNQREQALRTQAYSDVHSPVRFRVVGPVSDLDTFYQAFGCPVPAGIPVVW
ncbi:MAG TPA: M13 family metallopeptidase [Holophagaceae bacterium]|nr:M13 family metallopeptidase [Holophagaceae bacterium]